MLLMCVSIRWLDWPVVIIFNCLFQLARTAGWLLTFTLYSYYYGLYFYCLLLIITTSMDILWLPWCIHFFKKKLILQRRFVWHDMVVACCLNGLITSDLFRKWHDISEACRHAKFLLKWILDVTCWSISHTRCTFLSKHPLIAVDL